MNEICKKFMSVLAKYHSNIEKSAIFSKPIIRKIGKAMPLVSVLIILLIYIIIRFDISSSKVSWLFCGIHPEFYLACKCVAIVGVSLAVVLGFSAARRADPGEKFPFTAMALTVGASSGLISVDTTSQYMKIVPSENDGASSIFHLIDNASHLIGLVLIILVSLALFSPCWRELLFNEIPSVDDKAKTTPSGSDAAAPQPCSTTSNS